MQRNLFAARQLYGALPVYVSDRGPFRGRFVELQFLPTMKSAAEASISAPTTLPDDALELSVVMPCLNEKATVGVCIEKALDAMKQRGIRGEVIVADNGSTDRSGKLPRRLGRESIRSETRGYGSALREVPPPAGVSF